jgi:hypothetical protein
VRPVLSGAACTVGGVTTEPMARIGAAIELGQRGEREATRAAFAELWEQVTEPLHRCAVAHAMADVQDDVRQELDWDLRALDAAHSVTDEDTTEAGMPGGAAAMLPSLHLNVGDAHRRLGDLESARRHAKLGLAAASALSDDGYGRGIRVGLKRLAGRLSTS